MKINARPLDLYKWSTTSKGTLLQDAPTGGLEQHRQFAASAAHRWRHCYASAIPLPRHRRREPGTPAKEGTACHLLLAWVLSHLAEGQRPEMPDYIEVEGEMFECTTEMQYAVSNMRNIWREADETWSERTVTPFPTYADVCGGTTDLITWTESSATLAITDLKFGRMPVAARDNPQLLLYALGAIRETEKRPQHVVLRIWQPRTPGPSADEWAYTADELKSALMPLLVALNEAQTEPERAIVGEWCKWCDHQPTCTAFLSRAYEVTHPNTDLSDMHELRTAAEHFLPIKAWVEAVDLLLRQALQEGKDLPGLKLVHGPGRRKWAVPETTIIDRMPHLIESQYDVDDLFVLKSLAQLEKMVPNNKRKEFKNLTERGQPSLLLVSTKDSRPAVGAGDEFSDNADLSQFDSRSRA